MSKKDKKPKSLKDISPFNINSLLVKQAGLTSKYSGGDSYTGYGEIDIDKMLDPVKDALSRKMKDEEEEDKKTSGGGGGDTYNQYISGDYVGGDKNISGGGGGTTTGDDSKTNKKDDDGPVDETKEGSPCDCEPLNCTGDDASYDIPTLTGKGAGVIDANGNCTNCPTCDDARIKDDDDDDGVVDQYCECEGPKKGEIIPPGQDSASFCECEEKPVEPEDNDNDDDDGDQTKLCECEGPKKGQRVPVDEDCNCDDPAEPEEPEEPSTPDVDFKGGFVTGLKPKQIKQILTKPEGTQTNVKDLDGNAINIKRPKGQNLTRLGLGTTTKTGFEYENKGPVDAKTGKKAITKMVNKGLLNGQEFRSGFSNILYDDGDPPQVSGIELDVKVPAGVKGDNKIPTGQISLNQYRDVVTKQYNNYKEAIDYLKKVNPDVPIGCYIPASGNTGCPEDLGDIKLEGRHFQALQLNRAGFFDQAKLLGITTPFNYSSPLNQREKKPVTQEDKLIIGPPYSDEYLISRGVDPKVYRQLVAEQKKEQPVSPRKKKKSPFERRDRSYLNVRKKWMPTSSPMMQMEQPGMEQPQQNQETIFDKMQMYGDGVREKVDKFVSNARYDSQVDKPIKAINNQEWVGKITEFLKQKKNELIEAKKNKDKQQEQKIFEHVNTLINDVTTYASKFESWRDRNGGDTTPGNMGGNMTSDGSMKDKRFEADLAFVGDTNTDLGVTEEGKIGIKSYGLDDLKYVEDLDQGVFMKDFAGYKNFLEMSKTIQEDAESGRPKNQNIINGQADLLLKNRDSLLSWAHDPLYGQAWIQDYAQGNPDEDLSWAMPESDQFDKDRLEDEVHGWLTDKLSQAYDKYAPKKDLEDVDKIQQETMSSIGDGNYSKQTPMQYKTRAQQLIEKYS